METHESVEGKNNIKSKPILDINKIINGEISVTVQPVDYTTPQKKKELDNILKEKNESLRKKRVNRPELNKFVVKPLSPL